MATETTGAVTITNAGPIEGSFAIPLDGPGLYELRGSKGLGKTTILNALSLISGHRVSITVHDGELRGAVEGFGVVAPIDSRKKSRGDREVSVLDSERFDLADLIDAPGKTPETRDATRIKALASLSGVRLTAEDFAGVVAIDEFERLGIKATEDPVLFSQRVKNALDAEAKQKESYAATATGHAEAHEARVEEVDLTAESDPSVLADKLDEASGALAKMKSDAASANTAAEAAKSASESLAEAKAQYHGLTSGDVAEQLLNEAEGELKALRGKEAEIQQRVASAIDAVRLATGHVDRAKDHERVVGEWGRTIALSRSMFDGAPSEADIKAATQNVTAARQANEDGVHIRDAKSAAGEAKRHRDAATAATKEAKSLRGSAATVFNVLTDALALDLIRIESIDGNPRLFVTHDKRQKVYFDQENGLSDGERVFVSLTELLPHLGSPGLFPIPQRTYQDLPNSDRKRLAEYAEEHGLFLFGAQVDDGPLAAIKVKVTLASEENQNGD